MRMACVRWARASTWAQAFYFYLKATCSLPCTFLLVSALCLFALRSACFQPVCLVRACTWRRAQEQFCRYPHQIHGYATGGHLCNCRYVRQIKGTVPLI
jgi:hypothetical protein